MKKLVIIENTLNDFDTIASIVSDSNMTPTTFGLEKEHFNYIQPLFEERIKTFLGENYLYVNKNSSGVFRKPYPFLHFEDHSEKTRWVVITAIKPTTISFYKHIRTESENIYSYDTETLEEFIPESINPSNWVLLNLITLRPNDSIIFPPQHWHRIESELIQVFYLDSNLSNETQFKLKEITKWQKKIEKLLPVETNTLDIVRPVGITSISLEKILQHKKLLQKL